MKVDAWVSWVIYTISTAAFYVLGATVLAGILNAVFLIGVAIATMYLSRRQTDPRVRDGVPTTVMLWASAFAITFVGVMGLINV